MIYQGKVIGFDCGASFTKAYVIDQGKIKYKKLDLPGCVADLVYKGKGFGLLGEELKKFVKFKNYIWVVAMAGIDSERERDMAEKFFRRMLFALEITFKKIVVINDAELIFWAGSKEATGISLVAGTGSNCISRDVAGKMLKVGGAGQILSDEGSGYALGLRCLKLVTKMCDGRVRKDALVEAVFRLYGVSSLIGLKEYFFRVGNSKTDIARTAKLLLKYAAKGLDPAREVVEIEVLELVGLVLAMNKKLGTRKYPVYLSGSLFKSDYFLELFEKMLHKVSPNQEADLVEVKEGFLNLAEK